MRQEKKIRGRPSLGTNQDHMHSLTVFGTLTLKPGWRLARCNNQPTVSGQVCLQILSG